MSREPPTNREVADRLQLIGDLLELDGAVRHRVLAYRRAAARIRSTTGSVAEMAVAGRATDLPDIGTTLQAKIVELTETGERVLVGWIGTSPLPNDARPCAVAQQVRACPPRCET